LSGVYPLIICSAMPHNFIEVKLRKKSLFAYFKKIFSAVSDFNMTKKDSSFYLEVCRRMQISPSQLVHVGDNYQADYLAPSKVGVRAFFLDRTNSRKEGKLRVVSNLIEFLKQIEKA
ncbi:HAD family hydrolase, partial [Candidatus Aerophobetes bacterium]|nr:HAD family hydrolase [Candidatus Aerophobetes bacterium]